ncbi:MAG TPA: phospho-N-acetylmuramoyl-pentapeptide-transferase [Kosmotogaceae bacterium]|nr:MAG: Phospho-N-acetylmuramoyl-pentapeptide-transferase [Thermotogales bacterium 46_20]HAA85187.1 phospho-N-acetylmuramoyl-pentapeptide-transferase [Kosmotogaceae bacterium]
MIREVLVLLLSFSASSILLKPFIAFQKKRRIGQFIREEGPDLHNHKTGTPTSAGLVFVSLIIAFTLIFDFNAKNAIIVLSGILFGYIGLIDDVAKIRKRNARGVNAWTKLLLQFLSGAIVLVLVYYLNPESFYILRLGPVSIELGWARVPVSLVILAGMSNGVNLTDGVDGLAASVMIFAILPLVLVSPQSIFFSAMIGSLAGFLLHNWHPAKIFMGDTGSLAMGGMLATAFVVTGQELLLLLFGFVFVAEILSDIIQVSYFKATGKRVFLMAPIHHHFELKGWKETRIAVVFSIVALSASLIGLLVINGG